MIHQAPKASGAKRGRKPGGVKAAKEEDDVKEDVEFEVEAIVDSKTIGKTLKYFVKWKGYTAKENTWESAANLEHAADLVKEYEATADKKPAAKATAIKKKGPAAKKAAAGTKKVSAKKAGRPAGRAAGRPKKA